MKSREFKKHILRGLSLLKWLYAAQMAIVAVIAIGLMLWLIPKIQTAKLDVNDKTRFELEDKARTTLAQVIGGGILLAGFYFTWRKLQIDKDGQVTDRYTSAIEQLGSNNLTVRLGGIYALERIGRDSQYDYGTIMEVLTTFARNRFAVSDSVERVGYREVPPDLQAIMTVVGRRTYKQMGHEIENDSFLDLWDIDCSRMKLNEADLRGVNFFGVKFDGSDLRNSNLASSSLRGASFLKADLQGIILNETNLDKADLSTAKHLTWKQIKTAVNWDNAILPGYLEDQRANQAKLRV